MPTPITHLCFVNVKLHVRTWNSTSARRHGWCTHVEFHVRTWSLKKLVGWPLTGHRSTVDCRMSNIKPSWGMYDVLRSVNFRQKMLVTNAAFHSVTWGVCLFTFCCRSSLIIGTKLVLFNLIRPVGTLAYGNTEEKHAKRHGKERK